MFFSLSEISNSVNVVNKNIRKNITYITKISDITNNNLECEILKKKKCTVRHKYKKPVKSTKKTHKGRPTQIIEKNMLYRLYINI